MNINKNIRQGSKRPAYSGRSRSSMTACSHCKEYRIPFNEQGYMQARFTSDDKYKKWPVCDKCFYELEKITKKKKRT